MKEGARAPGTCHIGGDVSHIHFTDLDTSRVVVGGTAGPVAEAVFALDLFSHPEGTAHKPWHGQVQQALAARSGGLAALVRDCRLAQLLPLLSPRADGGQRPLSALARQQALALREFCELAVVPYWPSIREYLESQRSFFGSILVAGGVEQVLTSIHPRARWHAPVLDLPLGQRTQVHLEGRGLALTPSLFLRRSTCVFVEPASPGARCRLIFPAPPDRAAARLLWGEANQPTEALAALLGRTRAGILKAAFSGASTREMARRVGITSAGASQHTAVLREAGLISTRRDRNAAVHTITSLGIALLDRDRWPGRWG